MVLLDLFSGTGGFPLGFLQAGFHFSKHYFSEIDPHAIANYKYNFPKAVYAGAIEKINAKKIPRPDLITFGFPCQDVSAAGKQNGLAGKRSGLFYQALRLIRQLRPSLFIFENVKGLLSSNEGQDFQTVLKEIANLGIYDCQWQLLNSSWLRPQNRERIYFIGSLREYGCPQIFPFTENDFKTCSSISNKTRVAKYIQYDCNGKGKRSQNNRVYKTEFDSPALTSGSLDHCKIFNNGSIRRLTPIECERLQGYDDDWTFYGNYKGIVKAISDQERYHLMGNAVSTPLVKLIANKIKESLTTDSF